MAYQPKVIDKWLNVTQEGYTGVVRYHSRGTMTPKIIVLHVQEGTNWGSWQWFHQVLASSTVLLGKNGDIWRIVAESVAPWTNGDVKSPSYLMQTIMNRWGWDPNTYTLSIEHEGNSGGLPYTDAQMDASAWQCQQWMERYGIAADMILGHYEINSVDRSHCPDPPPHSFVKSVRQRASVGAMEPDTGHDLIRDPWRVVDATGKTWDGKSDITVNGIKFYGQPTTVRVGGVGVNQRQWASQTANMVGNQLAPGAQFQALGWVEGEEVSGERRWWVRDTGARIWAGATTDKPKAPAPIPVTPDDGVSQPDQGNNRDAIPVVLNGNTYYPVWIREPATGKLRMRVRAKQDANIRLWASTHAGSPVTGTLKKGDVTWVSHFVKGEAVDMPGLTNETNRDIWYVLDPAVSGDGIRTGGRIWSGLIEFTD